MPRLKNKNLLPTIVKNRNLGNIVLLSSISIGTATLSNTDEVVFAVTTSAKNGQRIFCVPDISVYVGTVTAANQLPGGSSITESDWQIVFMGNDLNTTDSFNTKTDVYIRNISAGASQVVTIRTQSRVIVNTAL